MPRRLLLAIAALFLIQALCFNSGPPSSAPPGGEDKEASEPQAGLQQNENGAIQESQSIGDLVWEDLNENGIQEVGEPGLSNIQVVLLSDTGTLLGDALTDEQGEFSLALPDGQGQYQLRVDTPEGYAVTAYQQGSDETLDNNAQSDGTTSLFFAAELIDLQSIDIGLIAVQAAGKICPLTGEEVADGELGLAPLAISLSHFPPNATRPPTGLTWAPWVFELYIGEGQTRLLSLFYCGFGEMQMAVETLPVDSGTSADEVRIEGVRSGRVIYGEIAKYYGAAIIQGGSDQTNVAPAIEELVCANAYGNDPENIGSGGLSIDRLLGLAVACRELLGDRQLASYVFDATPPVGGAVGVELLMIYNIGNQTRWVYDAAQGGYLRYQNGANSQAEFETFTLSTDRLTEESLVRQNVIVMGVEHIAVNPDETIFNLANFDFSRGPAKLFRNGMVYDVCWSTLNTEPDQKELQPIRFTDCAGNSIALAPGNSWVNVVNLGDQFLQEVAPGQWQVRFSAPGFQ